MLEKDYISSFLSFNMNSVPTDFKIATMTIFISMRDKALNINLNEFFQNIQVSESGILYAEFDKKKNRSKILKFHQKKVISVIH